MVARGQCGGDRHRDRCGDLHRDRRLVGLVVLTWWPVSRFGGRRLVGWVAFGLLGLLWVLGGFYFVFFFFLGFWFQWDFVGPRVVVARWDRRFERIVVVGAWW